MWEVMWDWECAESGRLQFEPHGKKGRGLVSDAERDQCRWGGLAMWVWSSGVVAKSAVKSLQQVKVKMEGEQH